MITQAYKNLSEKGIKPSIQRVAIMQYLLDNRTHPTADEIFVALHPSMPTLSKTTVYNTLKLFARHGAALCIDIEGKNSRFDGDVSPHAHFMCDCCGRIYDLPVKNMEMVDRDYLKGFFIKEISVYLKGYCPECGEHEQHNNTN